VGTGIPSGKTQLVLTPLPVGRHVLPGECSASKGFESPWPARARALSGQVKLASGTLLQCLLQDAARDVAEDEHRLTGQSGCGTGIPGAGL